MKMYNVTQIDRESILEMHSNMKKPLISEQVVDDLKNHPLKKMMELGLKVTINSDDPAYFGGQVNKNYIEIQKALNLSKENLYQLAKNSFEYSFLNADKKALYLNELETYYSNNK